MKVGFLVLESFRDGYTQSVQSFRVALNMNSCHYSLSRSYNSATNYHHKSSLSPRRCYCQSGCPSKYSWCFFYLSYWPHHQPYSSRNWTTGNLPGVICLSILCFSLYHTTGIVLCVVYDPEKNTHIHTQSRCYSCLTLWSFFSVEVAENGNWNEGSTRHSGPGSSSGMCCYTHTDIFCELIRSTHRSLWNDKWPAWIEAPWELWPSGNICLQCYNPLLTFHCTSHLFSKNKHFCH